MIKKFVTISILAAMAVAASARVSADYNTIPLPHRIVDIPGVKPFVLGSDVTIAASPELATEASFLRSYLPEGLKGKSSGNIVLKTGLVDTNPEAYTIEVSPEAVIINGASAAGTFRGLQTLRKSLPVEVDADGTVALPAASIYDRPRFGYRGTHFDVSRHFFNVDEVKTFIDMAALHGVNTFHWHLTDDQGWRLEIKKYPRLAEVGSYRPNTIIGRGGSKFDNTPVSGYYTQEQVKDIIKYAADRHIQVIPEIDLPSHMIAALAAYPELGCTGGPYEVFRRWGVFDDVLCPGNDKTMQFLSDVLNEVMDLFPAPYIHIGGDECPKVRWKACPKCQARIKDLGLEEKEGLSPEAQLQGYVTTFACDVVRRHGKTAIGWDEILECDIPSDAVIMSWRGVQGAADGARRGHRVILTPTSHCYFDFYQTRDTKNEPLAIGGYTPVEKVYSFEPVLPSMTPEEASLVLGCQSNLWTEYIPTFSHAQYMELPRLAALSEVQWLDPSKKDYENFKKRVPRLLALYDKLGYNYARHIGDVETTYAVDPKSRALNVTMSSLPGHEIRYTVDGTKPTASSSLYTAPITLRENCVFNATTFHDGKEGRAVSDTLAVGPLTFGRCTLAVNPDEGYKFGGAQQLVDGLSGNNNYRTGRWLGFSGKNLDATIELPEAKTLSTIGFNVDIVTPDGLFDCRGAEVYGSTDGEHFSLLASEEYPEMDYHKRQRDVARHELTFAPTKLKAVRLVVKPQWILPDDHELNGCLGFLFVDEITAR